MVQCHTCNIYRATPPTTTVIGWDAWLVNQADIYGPLKVGIIIPTLQLWLRVSCLTKATEWLHGMDKMQNEEVLSRS